MSIPSYVLNWDEFAIELAKDIVVDNVDLDTTGVENILNEFFPEIIDLLEDIRNLILYDWYKYTNYDQRITGFHIKTNKEEDKYVLEFKNDEKDMYITGVTCNHSHIEDVDDFFNVSVVNGENTELIFKQIYLKDDLQHKHLSKYFPVPAGYTIRITHYNPSLQEKHIWYDLEYLEYYGEREDWIIPIEPVVPIIPTNPKPEDPTPDKPENLDFLYFCDGSVNANNIDTHFWDWGELSRGTFKGNTGQELTGEYWSDRNKLIDLFNSLSEDKISRNKIITTDFHKFLFKVWTDSKSGKISINKTWEEFDEWCNDKLPCLNDLQRASLFYTAKCRICTNVFPDNIKFTEGKIPDVISNYIGKLPYKVVDWIDYNDIVEDSGEGIIGATAYDLFVPANPNVFKEFTSFVNVEPQSLLYDEYSLHGSSPRDYVNTNDNFWGAVVPPSMVDWTGYKTNEYSNAKTAGDNETIKGIIAAEVVIHEYGHCVDYYYNNIIGHELTKKQEWLDIRGASSSHVVKDNPANVTGDMPITNTGHEAPVTDYACSDPAEDFAEAFVVYIVNPDFMKAKYPQRYNFMEKYVKPLL